MYRLKRSHPPATPRASLCPASAAPWACMSTLPPGRGGPQTDRSPQPATVRGGRGRQQRGIRAAASEPGRAKATGTSRQQTTRPGSGGRAAAHAPSNCSRGHRREACRSWAPVRACACGHQPRRGAAPPCPQKSPLCPSSGRAAHPWRKRRADPLGWAPRPPERDSPGAPRVRPARGVCPLWRPRVLSSLAGGCGATPSRGEAAASVTPWWRRAAPPGGAAGSRDERMSATPSSPVAVPSHAPSGRVRVASSPPARRQAAPRFARETSGLNGRRAGRRGAVPARLY